VVSHARVMAAHVTLVEAAVGGPQLVCYVVATDRTKPPSTAALREHLGGRLPTYLHPTAWVFLDALPLNPNGKIDRKALPTPGAVAHTTYQPPATPVEYELVRVWQKVLGHDRVGVFDNFFDLGGHSLLAIQLVNSTNRETSIQIGVRDLFTHPTIRGLVGLTAAMVAANEGGTVVTLRPAAAGGRRLFCVHPSGGSVHWYYRLAHSLRDGDGLLGIQAPGVEGDAEPLAGISDLVDTYLRDLRREQPVGPYALLGWSLSGPIALEMARRLRGDGERVDLLLLEPSWPDRRTIATLEQTIAEHRRAADLIDALVARRAAAESTRAPTGESTVELERRLTELARSSDVLSEVMLELDSSVTVRTAGLLYEAFAAWDPVPYDGDADIVVTPECVGADLDHPSKASVGSYAEYLAELGRLMPSGPRVHLVGGDHLTMLGADHASEVAEVFYRVVSSDSPSISA
jgi:thioesterase domain-containing protein